MTLGDYAPIIDL